MTTDEELVRLESDGLSADDRIWVAHFFSHVGSQFSERNAFREALESAGFGVGGKIGSEEEISGDGYWHHWTYTEIAASAQACRRMDTMAQAIADEHGVRYDTWEVARDSDGKPREIRP